MKPKVDLNNPKIWEILYQISQTGFEKAEKLNDTTIMEIYLTISVFTKLVKSILDGTF